ncbi:Retrovirus-related Pol polyprotein from transposon TNT 1-94 [Penicillium subrubescens]|uniref:Retrovirus-related Pol polyprotein from transposon TNT 1-94 n=1 Tax=Penicillium subrubescens TaxID=1316194 RepID=A0A1Q5TEE5_9EURO|nr:Retrovirus-related Pol polyprotein from transposon TNT 1-94 [Penicillium subrubescens]
MSLQHDSSFAKSPAARVDYSNFIADPSTAAGGAVTQITDVPESYTLHAIDDKLTNANDFDTWLDDVTRILQQKNLHRLIDAQIERPPTTSPHAARWFRVSKDIQSWLYQSVSKEINRLMLSRRTPTQFADEYIGALKETLNKTGYHAAIKDCVAWWETRRSQFTSGIEFLTAFRDRYAKTAQKMVTPPFLIAGVLLHEIRGDIPTMIVARHTNNDRIYANPEDFKDVDLHKLFNELENELESAELHSITAASIDKASSNNPNPNASNSNAGNLGRFNNSEYWPLKNTPPRGKGANIGKWIEEWKNSEPQTTPNGCCTFCGRLHMVRVCAHISIEHRAPDWKPVKGIWVSYPWKHRDNMNGPKPDNWNLIYDNRIRKDGTSKPYPNMSAANTTPAAAVPPLPTPMAPKPSTTASTQPSTTLPQLPLISTTLPKPTDQNPSAAAIYEDDLYPQYLDTTGFASMTLEESYISTNDCLATTMIDDDDWFDDDQISQLEDYDFEQGRIPQTVMYTGGVDQNMPIPLSMATIARSRGEWIVDSGASRTICVDGDAIMHFEPYKDNAYRCQTSEGRTLVAKGKAIARINLVFPDRVVNLDVRCEYVPEGPFNLLSTTRTYYEHGMGWKDWKNTFVNPLDESIIMAYAYRKRGVPFLHTTSIRPSQSTEALVPSSVSYAYSLATITPELAHFRLGHVGQPTARINHHRIGDQVHGDESFDCEPCRRAKSRKIVSHTPQKRASKPWHFIHIDIQPCKPTGINGTNYMVVICDDATRMRWALPIKTRDASSQALIKWATIIFNVTGYWPIEVRIDGDLAFRAWIVWIEGKGTLISPSAPYTHEQNGVAEFTGHIIMQSARTLMISAPEAPAFLWPEAAIASTYILNRIRRPNQQESPIETWNRELNLRQSGPIDLGFLRVWYSKAYVHIPKERRVQGNKMAPRAWIGYLVGYEGENGHIYRIYDPSKKQVVSRRDVAFWEEPLPLRKIPKPIEPDEIAQEAPKLPTQMTIHGEKIEPHTVRGLQPRTPMKRLFGDLQDPDTPLPTVEGPVENPPDEYLHEQHLQHHQHMPTPTATESIAETITSSNAEPLPESNRSTLERETSSVDPISTISTNANPPIAPNRRTRKSSSLEPTRRSQRAPQPRQLTPGMTTYPAKGAMVLREDDGSYYTGNIEDDDVIGPGLICTATERIRSGMVEIPHTHLQAMKTPYAEYWLQAEKVQLGKIAAANTMTLVPRPPKGTSILPGKWVYDLKQDSEGYILEFRARWVVCGNRQTPGVDFQPDERYAPVASDAAAKLFLSMAAISGYRVWQWDVVAAYLNAALDNRAIFMKQPTGHEYYSPDGTDFVCLLNQALYGLRQAGYLWHEVCTKDLDELGLEPLESEPCIYTNPDFSVYILIYVDDMLATGEEAEVAAIRQGLASKRKLKELPFSRFLGCDITREGSVILANQQAYLTHLIRDEGLQNTNPASIPMNPSWRTPIEKPDPADCVDKLKYAQKMGKVGWLSIKMRPDIASAVSKLQRRSGSPREADMLAYRDLLQYLAGTIDLGIPFGRDPTKGLEGYVDSSYGDAEDGKSTEAYIWFFAGAPISWSSNRQEIVAASSTMAEYCAMTPALKEGLYLAKLCADLGLRNPLNQDEDFEKNTPLLLHSDSDNAITTVMNSKIAPKMNWISTRYHLIRDCIRKNLITLVNIPSKANPADILTKAKPHPVFEENRRDLLHMRSPVIQVPPLAKPEC